MKTCLKCDAKATNAALQCAKCGSEFSYVSDEPDPEFEAYKGCVLDEPKHPMRAETSGWIKLIAVCLVALLIMFGYYQFSSSRLADCRSQALQANTLGRVLDVRLSGLECEYLVQMSTFGVSVPESPRWMPQSSFEVLLLTRGDNAPNQ